MRRPDQFRDLTASRFRWNRWERLINKRGITIDRPRGSVHPDHAGIIYPIDYGFVPMTTSSDGHEVDVFVGSARTGLVGLIITHDFRKRDREFKLLFDCSPEDVYLVNGFINFDRRRMDGELVLRRPMTELWKAVGGRGPAGNAPADSGIEQASSVD